MLNARAGFDPQQQQRWDATIHRYYAGEMSPESWRRWQQERLRSVVAYVQRNAPFYADHLRHVDPAELSLATLDTLPTTSKQDLRLAQQGVLSAPMSQAAVYYETTGTTGSPTPCPRSPLDMEISNVHVTESWRRVIRERFSETNPMVGFMGPAELYAFGDTFGDVTRDLGIPHVKIWPESPRVGFRKALRLLRELNVEIVVCAPALTLNLARAAIHNGFDPATDFGLKLFFVLGEVCTDEFARNVHSVWQADVLPTLYGSQEALAIATGCDRRRMHLSKPNYIAEVLDPETGRSRGQQGEGELCLTMLGEGIKPLIRYRTADYVRLGVDPCECGHPGEVVEVLGRVADGIQLGTANMQPAQIESIVLAGVDKCLGYQVVITDPRDGRDQVVVKLSVPPRAATGDLAAPIRQRFAEIGVDASVEIEPDLDPITNTGAYVSWKAARIKDERVPDDPLVESARQNAQGHVVTS